MIPVWLQEWGNGRNVVLTLLLWGLFAGLLFGLTSYPTLRAANEHQPLLEERFGYGPADAQAQMQRLGPWRDSYRNIQILDYIHAFLLAIALVSALLYFLGRLAGAKSPLLWLALAPMVALVAELAENTCFIWLTMSYPVIPAKLVRLASLGTMLKLTADTLAILLSLGSGLLLGVKTLIRR